MELKIICFCAIIMKRPVHIGQDFSFHALIPENESKEKYVDPHSRVLLFLSIHTIKKAKCSRFIYLEKYV